MKEKMYETIIVGAGVSGTALAHVLANYTNVKDMLLIEKYSKPATVNSSKNNNSQTLHYGDIETNYTVEKAKSTKEGAVMVQKYVERNKTTKNLYNKTQKMVLAVGKAQSDKMRQRYEEFKHLFPELKLIDRKEIEKIEPNVVKGRSRDEEIVGFWSPNGYAVNFERLSESFLEKIKDKKKIETIYNTKITDLKKTAKGYTIESDTNTYHAKTVVICAGAHSLWFAQKIGVGKHLGLMSVAGSFFGTNKKLLNGKVYTVQLKKLPFAAIHGDPDVNNPNETRFGPSAKVLPMLERYHYNTVWEYFTTSALTIPAILSLLKIMSDPVMLKFGIRNTLYDLPIIGRPLFLKQVKRIIPTIKASDIVYRKGYGGLRPQIIDTRSKSLNMGEAKLESKNIIFNITPSPGASTCLKNAEIDTKKVIEMLGKEYSFDQKKFDKDFRV